MTKMFALHKLPKVEWETWTARLNSLNRNHAPLDSAICKTFTSFYIKCVFFFILKHIFLSWDAFTFHHNCDTVLMVPSLPLLIAANSH